MINRILIRIKVVQMLYSYLLTKEDRTLVDAKNELKKSLEKTFELYHALLWIMVDLTRLQEMNLDYAKNKYLPSEEDLNPNTRFVDNQFVAALLANKELVEFVDEHPVSWHDEIFMNLMLEKIINSQIYKDYMGLNETDFHTDTEFWRNIMKKVILVDEDFAEFLESKSVYWNDDLSSVSTFLLKTMNRWGEGKPQKLMPMFKDKEDEKFGEQLFTYATANRDKYNQIIDQFVNSQSWDKERIALMDRVILVTAIAEVLNFPKIPTTVTLNEYIDIAKYYSSQKSKVFINGVLDNVIKYLKSEGKINKDS